jgi:xylose dehydrogenase (NAD/NADP)
MTLRWGILGCARISRRGLIPGILASQSGTLVALASRRREVAEAWAREFRIPKAVAGYEELLSDPAIEAVYIPLPNELHAPWTRAAADAGKHVLCEKPLALNASEARAMVTHCQSRGVLLMEAFMWRHQNRSGELKRLVNAGRIGTLKLIRCSFSFPIEPGDWRLDPARGGGALWDVGCYGLNAARFFTGLEPVAFQAVAKRSPSGVDLSLAAALRFPGGVLALFDCSFEQPFRCTIELVGSSGVIDVPDAFLPPQAGPASARLRILESRSDADASSDQIETIQCANVNQYANMVDAFASCVASGRLNEPAEDGLAQMLALDAIRQAAEASTPLP